MDRIEKVNPIINAIVAIDQSVAIENAKQADKKTLNGEELNLLHGLRGRTFGARTIRSGVAPLEAGSFGVQLDWVAPLSTAPEAEPSEIAGCGVGDGSTGGWEFSKPCICVALPSSSP